jgi:hypothetical protein
VKAEQAQRAAIPGTSDLPCPLTPRLRWWREILYILAFYGVYTLVRDTQGSAGGGTTGRSAVIAYHHARGVIRIERDLWIYHEQQVQRFFLHHLGWATHAFFDLWNLWYGSAHFIVTAGVVIWLFRRDPARYTLWRNTLAVATALALIGFATFPLMPPRLLDFPFPNIAPHHPYRFVDTLAKYGGSWSFGSGAMQKVSNQFAAMPSLHIAWSMWCTLAVYPSCRRRWTRALAIAYPVATLLCIVVTANHFVLDAVGGLVILMAAIVIARPLTRLVHLRLAATRGG